MRDRQGVAIYEFRYWTLKADYGTIALSLGVSAILFVLIFAMTSAPGSLRTPGLYCNLIVLPLLVLAWIHYLPIGRVHVKISATSVAMKGHWNLLIGGLLLNPWEEIPLSKLVGWGHSTKRREICFEVAGSAVGSSHWSKVISVWSLDLRRLQELQEVLGKIALKKDISQVRT